LAATIVALPGETSAPDAIESAVLALAAIFPPEHREFAARVQAVTVLHDELRERAGLEYAGYATSMRTALIGRGTPEVTSAVAPELGLLAFRTGLERWVDLTSDDSLDALVSEALAEVLAAGRDLKLAGTAGGRAASLNDEHSCVSIGKLGSDPPFTPVSSRGGSGRGGLGRVQDGVPDHLGRLSSLLKSASPAGSAG
jgi:hypothetical protein